ncbi:DUF1573 domain-containing protein [Parabacteroides distasonis]|uniref:DUF1573 domain-containing protein n=1 Tax=Parabacteroides distasonis TaxID=823 RepID=UPI00189EC3E9|nr:DUF1573 domain-containing protein [Parabacteroides distasonis]MDB9153159.1 DUF1573 domain-containing protein [Parabacteroides distasonis]MDB9157731.1 DUF1573 domain-containing protein [Parabacteroides distasonis]MDB9166596.1 DUF1573 domain-containing protein [Parabacteroides distasonis]MDB9171015.1 DUF1573 domain-containing protein [Parabacteroides distasonis]MDB9193599.1 DUF1573 domain-containing protein [Parabacteroides distasonis]
MKNYYLLILLNLIALLSCGKQKSDNELLPIVKEWYGKEVKFPDRPVFTLYGKDTVDYSIPQSSSYKVLVYVDSTGCVDCKLQLQKWQELIKYTNSISNGEIPFLFFFFPKDYKELCQFFKRDLFDLPVCIDFDGELNKLNHFPTFPQFHTLLLDKDNKVVVIGNPVHSTDIRSLYMKEISKKYDTANEKEDDYTTGAVTPIKADLGIMKVGEIKKQVFEVKNTGDKPLVIITTSTTCSCASVEFPKKPILPGEIATVEVSMMPKNVGFFNEIIMLKCNTEYPAKLRIRGRAE